MEEPVQPPAPLPRGPRFLGMSGGTLLTAAFFMPVVQVCDRTERAMDLRFDWGGVNPNYLFGMLVLVGLATLMLRGNAMLPNVAKVLRIYLILWTVRDVVMWTSNIWKDFLSENTPEWESYMVALCAAIPMVLIRVTFVRGFADARTLGRMMWLGAILWAPWFVIGFNEGFDKLLYGFWVTLAGVAMIAASGAWIERESRNSSLTQR